MTIIGNGKRFSEVKYPTEKDFEEDVLVTSQILFGKDTIFINAKKKIESRFLHSPVMSHTESGPCRTVRGGKSAVVGIVP
jgi:hypothetical protein